MQQEAKHPALISVVVPMYCEEEVADSCHLRLSTVMQGCGHPYKIIYVNDGSKDNTLKILKKIASHDKAVRIISLSRNFGHQAAVTAGLKQAKGEACVIIDADLQDPPELIPEMIAKWREGYRVVYAQRRQRAGESYLKLLTAKYFYRFLNYFSEVPIPIDTGDFRLIDRRIIDSLNLLSEKSRFIRGLVSWVGFKQTAIMYDRDSRAGGDTKYPLSKMMKFAIDGITSFSVKPLMFSLFLGSFSLIFSFCMIVYALISKVIFPESVIKGWTSTIIAVTLFGGLNLFAIGIMGEYIGRIFEEVKDRPLYIVDEIVGQEEKETSEEIKKS